jgi:hypothetical protein
MLQLSRTIREIFESFDMDGNKRLDAIELRRAFGSMVCLRRSLPHINHPD